MKTKVGGVGLTAGSPLKPRLTQPSAVFAGTPARRRGTMVGGSAEKVMKTEPGAHAMLSEVGSSQEIGSSEGSGKKNKEAGGAEEDLSLEDRFEDMLKKAGITDPCDEVTRVLQLPKDDAKKFQRVSDEMNGDESLPWFVEVVRLPTGAAFGE